MFAFLLMVVKAARMFKTAQPWSVVESTDEQAGYCPPRKQQSFKVLALYLELIMGYKQYFVLGFTI